MNKFKHALDYLVSFSSGSLATSLGFYGAYDHWQPLAWSASIVAVIMIARNVVVIMDESTKLN